jgi:hypothetical protein
MNIANLEMQLVLAGVDKIKSDLAETKGAFSSTMADIDTAVGYAKGAFAAFVGVASVGAFAGMIKGSIDATGALKDLASKTGASEAALGEFRKQGAYTETSMDSITGAMGKLSKNMVTSTDDSKGAALAIRALGLDFDAIRQMKPEDQMLTLAASFNKFADGADKSAAAQALFGKSGAELLPFMKDLGEASEGLFSKLTDEEEALRKVQAAMADAFGDNLLAIRKESEGWKKDLATGMTPALYEASDAFLWVTKQSGGFKDQIKTMASDGTFESWTRNSIIGLTYVMDAFSGLGAVAMSAGKIVGGIAAIASSGDWTTMKASINALGEDLDKTWGEQTFGSKLRARMEEIKGVGMAAEATKPQLDVSAALAKAEDARKREAAATKAQEDAQKAHNAELKKQEDQYAKLIGSVDSKISNGLLELEQTGKLTDAQKIENKLYEDLANSVVVLTDKQLAETLARIDQLDKIERHIQLQKDEKKLQDDIAKDTEDIQNAILKRTDAMQAENDKLKIQNEQIGLTKDALIDLTIKRLDDQAAEIDATAKASDMSKELKEQARLLRERAGLIAEGAAAKQIDEETKAWQRYNDSISKGLSSALVDAVTNGKDIWLTFRDYIVKTVIDGAIKNALSSVISDGLNAAKTGLQSLWQSYAGSAGGSAAGSTAGNVTGSASGAAGSGSGSLVGSAVGSLATGTEAGSGLLGYAGSALGVNSAGFTGTGLTGSLGIGASAGTGVTTSAVTGGGSIVATPLAPLGAGGATTAGTGAAVGGTAAGGASLGMWGFGVPGAILMLAELYGDFDGFQNIANFDASGKRIPSTAPYAKQREMGHDWEFAEMAKVASAYASVASTLGIKPAPFGLAWDYNGDNTFSVSAAGVDNKNIPLSELGKAEQWAEAALLRASSPTPAQLDAIKTMFPGFRSGGNFGGGIRIVGEDGPELEATGPSRIFNAQQTQQILSGGGSSNAELATELASIRQLLMTIANDSKRTADATNGIGDAPMLVEIDV